jgi:hypothetical protein
MTLVDGSDAAVRAERLAATVPGVTLGRRLATFRAVRAGTAVPGPGSHGTGAPGPDGERPLTDRLAAAVGGIVVEGPRGSVVRVDAGTIRVPLDRERLSGLPGQPSADRPLVCLDTETTGLGTAAGTIAFTVGVGRWEGDDLRVVQLLLPDHADEPALLDAVTDELGDRPALVTYNGRTFDWPLLVARYRLHGRPAPVLGAHLDLLTTVRRLFRHRLGRAGLRVVEEGLLSVHRHDDVDGSEIPGLYLDFLRGGPAGPLDRIARHNAEDIRSLGRLLVLLDRGLADPAARREAHPGDLAALASLLRRDGRPGEAVECLDAALDTLRSGRVFAAAAVPPASGPAPSPASVEDDRWWSMRRRADGGGRPVPRGTETFAGPGPSGSTDPSDDLPRILAARARLLRRLGRPVDAIASWEEAAVAAGAGGAAAWIEVAKIREHSLRDHAGALAAADRAAALLERRRALRMADVASEATLTRRRARLLRRLARNAARTSSGRRVTAR